MKIKKIGEVVDIISGGGVKLNGKTLLDWICPVGTFIETDSDEHPVDTYGGGEWLKIEGRTLIGSGSIEPNGSEPAEGSTTALIYSVGDKPNAGLPDIVGTFTGPLNGSDGKTGAHTGAFYLSDKGSSNNNWGGNSSWNNTSTEGFKASLSNSIYGNSSTVQTNSYVTNIWQRIA